MGLRTLRWLFPAGLLLSVSLAHAQPTLGADATAPNNTVSVPSMFQYHSVFTHYHIFTEQSVLPWREANDDVGKIGGWRFYAKEASQPDATDIPTKPDHQIKQPAKPSTDADSHPGHGRKP
jgi:hypothetical protein